MSEEGKECPFCDTLGCISIDKRGDISEPFVVDVIDFLKDCTSGRYEITHSLSDKAQLLLNKYNKEYNK